VTGSETPQAPRWRALLQMPALTADAPQRRRAVPAAVAGLADQQLNPVGQPGEPAVEVADDPVPGPLRDARGPPDAVIGLVGPDQYHLGVADGRGSRRLPCPERRPTRILQPPCSPESAPGVGKSGKSLQTPT
jgi:hypothetical protein